MVLQQPVQVPCGGKASSVDDDKYLAYTKIYTPIFYTYGKIHSYIYMVFWKYVVTEARSCTGQYLTIILLI